jgi:nicotinamide phosphoribosyltransferase
MQYDIKEINRLIARFTSNDSINDISNTEDIIKNLIDALHSEEPNIVLLTDAYKYSHPDLYPDDLEYMVNYMESRGGIYKETMMFGMRYIIKKYLAGKVLNRQMIEDADIKLNGVGGVFNKPVFNKQRWIDMLEKYDGVLPVRIKAVREGTVVPVNNVLLKSESTDKEFAWIVGHLESLILRVWYPITVATLAFECKKEIGSAFKKAGYSDEFIKGYIQYVLNNFGFRGVSSNESDIIGGMAYLANFMGSDASNSSSEFIRYYDAKQMYGKSITATEHSVTTMLGEAGEKEFLRNFLKKTSDRTSACVMDGFDLMRAVGDYLGGDLKDLVVNRTAPIVVRPDSGDVLITLKNLFELLFEKFGYTTTSIGNRVLPDYIRVIQGDGVNLGSIKEIYKMLRREKIDPINLFLGMGGKLLQAEIDRDTSKYAIKLCKCIIGGVSYDVQKNPKEFNSKGEYVTSFKKSKKGDPKLVKTANSYYTFTPDHTEFDNLKCELEMIFENGIVYNTSTAEEIREMSDIQMFQRI